MSYMPQWRAKAGAQAILGRDNVRLWKRGHLHFIGLATGVRKVALASGHDWPQALRNLQTSKEKSSCQT